MAIKFTSVAYVIVQVTKIKLHKKKDKNRGHKK